MDLKPTTRRALEDLLEKSRQLAGYGFTEHAIRSGRGFRAASTSAGDWEIEFPLPDEEKRDASLLTLRLFIHQGEDYSFHRLDRIAADPQVSGEFCGQLRHIRRSYFAYRNSHPPGIAPGFFEEGTHPARGEIFDVVVNGSLSHTRDNRKRQQFKRWSRDEVRRSVLLQEFTQIMITLLKTIELLSGLAERELSAHPEEAKHPGT